MTNLEIFDTTLRDGEQADGARFTLNGRVAMYKHLSDLGIHYVELGWPLSSTDTAKSFEICRGLRRKNRAKIVAFGSTSMRTNPEEDENLRSLINTKSEYACIVGKTLSEHAKKQLKCENAEENFDKIRKSVEFLRGRGMKVFYDAEHYFEAFLREEDYALETLLAAHEGGAEKLVLCDTKGGMLPEEVRKIIGKTRDSLIKLGKNPNLGVHFHNDSGLAVANALVAVEEGVVQIQGTINGMGERVGNLDLSTFVPVLEKKVGIKTGVNLKMLKKVHDYAYSYSTLEAPSGKPFVGRTAFAHKGGIHVDAANKGLGYEHERPEDFGNKTVLLLTPLGGVACVKAVAEKFGLSLDKKDPEVRKKALGLLGKLTELENRGYGISSIEAEHYLLVQRYFGNLNEIFDIDWKAYTERINGKERSKFTAIDKKTGIKVGKETEVYGGPVDAAYKTITDILRKDYREVDDLKIVNYDVKIVQGKGEESIVRAEITFEGKGRRFETVGVDANVIESSVEAIGKAFVYYLHRYNGYSQGIKGKKTE